MRKWLARLRMLGLVAFTLAAVSLMVISAVGWSWDPFAEPPEPVQPTLAEAAPVPVTVLDVVPATVEITTKYSGIIRPFERHQVSFEASGRLIEYGTNERGEPLDEGDRVSLGQMLARLDDRLWQAQFKEATAELEKAQSDLARAEELKASRVANAITDAAYQKALTDVALADARREMVDKGLTDAVIESKVEGVISKRLANAGESVAAHRPILEIIEVDKLLLVVGVPESRIREVRPGQGVRIEFLGRDRYQRPWPEAAGEVYQVGQAADDTTGLFEVEIEVPNSTAELKPGLVGTAQIAIDSTLACRLPLSSALFRDGVPSIFSIREQDGRPLAHKVELTEWVEQGDELIVPGLSEADRKIVVRGQHRLVEGSPVAVIEPDERSEQAAQTDVPLRAIGAGDAVAGPGP